MLSSLFFPLISLIAALFLLGNQRDQRKRQDLVLWIWGSVTILVLQVVVVAAFVFAGSSSSSGVVRPVRSEACPDGAPDDGAAGPALRPGEYISLCNWAGKQTIAPSP